MAIELARAANFAVVLIDEDQAVIGSRHHLA
jgi:hypothetical protein